MNRLMLLGAAGTVLGLAACNPPDRSETRAGADAGETLRTISTLDCPEKQGKLTLAGKAADGRSCNYTMDGAEVTLRLVALEGGDATAALAPIEAELKGLIPAPAPKAAGASANVEAKEVEGGGGKAEINLPGLRIKADDNGADIRLGNIKIDADDGGARVQVGAETTVNANDEGAEIRTAKAAGGDVRSTYILASEKGSNGYHVVGYEARGPKAGPIVVAVVKARGEDRNQRDLFDDMKDLVERNVGD